MGHDSPVVVISAEVEQDGEWKTLESSGVAFGLRDFVCKKRTAQTENK
jgi:hypothetical protein